MPAPLPAVFRDKKTRILSSLSLPDSEYRDSSPKGSVDTAILPLIRDINASEGLVTTSSCAGRVTVYLAGPTRSKAELDGAKDVQRTATTSNNGVVPGGKGGGRWLYASHEPLELCEGMNLTHLYGLDCHESWEATSVPSSTDGIRLVRFQFEPMVCEGLSLPVKLHTSLLLLTLSPGSRPLLR